MSSNNSNNDEISSGWDILSREIRNENKTNESTNNSPIRKYLIFKLNNDLYGVALSDVKEVIGLPELTKIPGAPNYLLGMMNLRDRVVSIIDLKIKLGLVQNQEVKKRITAILVEINNLLLGCKVDSILEVINISEDQIESNIDINIKGTSGYVPGVAKIENKPLIIILDLKKISDISELIKKNSAA